MNMEENQGQIFRSLVTITAQISPLQTSKNYQEKKNHTFQNNHSANSH